MSGKALLTADAARELMQRSNPEWHVAEILEEVKRAATVGHNHLKTHACNFGDGSLYSGQPTDLQKLVIAGLKALGYSASIECEERQFVNIYLFVSWEGVKP